MSEYYDLVFLTNKGKQRSLRITNPNTDLPAYDLKSAIDTLIVSDIFVKTETGKMSSLKSAQHINETRTKLF